MSPALLVWLKLQGRISQSLLCQSLLLHSQMYLHVDLLIMLCEDQDVDVDDDGDTYEEDNDVDNDGNIH